MATLPDMLPQDLAAAVRTLLDSQDRHVAALSGAHAACTSAWNKHRPPTTEQQRAGNYKLGDCEWQGVRLRIENPSGTVREGVGEGGRAWRNVMAAHYGYIAGTRGADGDGIDVFLGPYPEGRRAWVINQRDAAGAFDEHKVLVGFHDQRAAVDAYRLSYMPGWDRYGPPVPLSLAQLRWWLAYADHARELTPDLVPPEQDDMQADNTPASTLTRVLWDDAGMPACQQSVADVLYMIRLDDANDGLLFDALTMADFTEGAEFIALDALVTEVGRLKPKMDALLRIMEAAGGAVKPLALQISEPMKRYGGVHVAVIFEMSDGQTVTIWLHNPDGTPAKLTPADDLVSWKWLLNKKDITIVVAPESGTDLNTREAARRIMRLVEKNSAAFARLNANRAGRMAEIQGLKETLTSKQSELAGLHQQIEVAKVSRSDRDAAAQMPPWKQLGFVPTTADGYAAIADDEEALAHWQDSLDELFTRRILEVRANLRELGWQGATNEWPMTRDEVSVSLNVQSAGAGRNVVGLQFRVESGLNLVRVNDDLTLTSLALAAEVHNAAVEMAKAEPENSEPNVAAISAGTQTPGYAEWEGKLITVVETTMKVSAGDAQVLVEAQERMQPGVLLRLFMSNYEPATAFMSLFPGAGTPREPGSDAQREEPLPEAEGTQPSQSDGSPTPARAEPEPPAETAEAKFLREVKAGAHDAVDIFELIDKIETAVKAVDAAGLLTGETEALVNDALKRWVDLESKAAV